MPYVMVPVPEEFEDELMQEVLKMSLRARLSTWAPESLRSLVGELDAGPGRLVELLAEASMANRRLSEPDIASSLDVSIEELREMVEEVNGRCISGAMPYLVLAAPHHGSDDEVDLLITRAAAAHLVPPSEHDQEHAS